jgi:hypothetical protein
MVTESRFDKDLHSTDETYDEESCSIIFSMCFTLESIATSICDPLRGASASNRVKDSNGSLPPDEVCRRWKRKRQSKKKLLENLRYGEGIYLGRHEPYESFDDKESSQGYWQRTWWDDRSR